LSALVFQLFDESHSSSVRWYLTVALICIYQWLMMLSTFSYTCWSYVSFFENTDSGLCPLFNWVICNLAWLRQSCWSRFAQGLLRGLKLVILSRSFHEILGDCLPPRY
jgi:hypothetical protein